MSERSVGRPTGRFSRSSSSEEEHRKLSPVLMATTHMLARPASGLTRIPSVMLPGRKATTVCAALRLPPLGSRALHLHSISGH